MRARRSCSAARRPTTRSTSWATTACRWSTTNDSGNRSLIDFVILQQDAFDEIDANCPIERQKMMYEMVLDICDREFAFAGFEECASFFKGLINLFRQMNYSEWKSEKFEDYRRQIEKTVSEKESK